MRHELNNDLYNRAGLKEFALREYVRKDYGVFRTMVPGFFTPYRSFADVQNQLKSPVAMPILCLAQAAQAGIGAIQELLLLGINLATLDVKRAFNNAKTVLGAVFGAILYTVLAVVDTLLALVALATRTGATLVAGFSIGASAAKAVGISAGTAVKGFFSAAPVATPVRAAGSAVAEAEADVELSSGLAAR